MAVITISREAASDGEQVATRLANETGHRLVDKQFIGRVLDQYGLIEFDREYESALSFWDKIDIERSAQRRLMMGLLTDVLVAVAQRGDVVILGRSGYAALGGHADVLGVRIQAPLATRASRLAADRGVSVDEANRELESVANTRREFVRRYYDVDWYDVRGFDIAVDTSKVSVDTSVRLIIEAARSLPAADAAGRESVQSASVDSVVAFAVDREFALSASAS